MAKEYIDREALMKSLCTVSAPTPTESWIVEKCIEKVNEQSAADVVEVMPVDFTPCGTKCPVGNTGADFKDVVEVVRKPVKGYEGYYEVDQFGRVFSVDRIISVDDNGRKYDKPLAGKQMKQSMHDKGYKTVSLARDGKTKMFFVHRLVAEAFIKNPDNLPMVNHKDEDKTNNFVENLEWCTNEYNLTYGTARQRQARKVRGRPLTEEHKRKISESMKNHFCSYGERRNDATD